MRWLFKTDPETYGWPQLVKEKKAVWDGVLNNLALKYLRLVRKGDLIFIYHTGFEKAVVGTARAASDAYPDPNQKDPKLAVVEVTPVKALSPVSLSMIKNTPQLKDWELVRFSRLSVMPVSSEIWQAILAMSRK